MSNRKPQQRTFETRAAIMAAASKLFAGRGYAETGLRDIAEEAECNQALISYHFGGKSGLYDAILVDSMEQFVARASEGLDESEAPIRALIFGFARAFAVTDHFVAIILREYLNPERMLDPEYGAILRRSMALTERMIEALAPDARARQFDPQFVHLSILSPMLLFIAARPVREAIAARDSSVSAPSLDQFAQQLAEILAPALE